VVNCGGGSFKSQLRRADRSGATVALILGASEVEREEVTVKPLRETGAEQQTLSQSDLVDYLARLEPHSDEDSFVRIAEASS
jgi:histidyl-tRNA synthetase